VNDSIAPQVERQRRPFDREQALKNVTENATCQATPECRENYFKSCEAHGGELAEVVAEVRKRFTA
jgi:hypothetical protein